MSNLMKFRKIVTKTSKLSKIKVKAVELRKLGMKIY